MYLNSQDCKHVRSQSIIMSASPNISSCCRWAYLFLCFSFWTNRIT